VELFLQKLVAITPFIKIIYSKFGSSWKQEQILDKNIRSIKDENSKSVLAGLIPNQTWQFNRGELVNQKDKQYNFMLLINYRKDFNRSDEIKSFKEDEDIGCLNKIGGNIVQISGVLREILFENAKLPKFGA
jgi:hypothetical protein